MGCGLQVFFSVSWFITRIIVLYNYYVDIVYVWGGLCGGRLCVWILV